jgi:streptomycin 6-kinase
VDTGAFERSPIDRYRSKDDWDATAAELVGTMLERWHLTAGDAYVGGEAASVLRVTTADGRPAVLKVGFPHVEGIWEAVALESWGQAIAPAVLRQDAWTWSLLLEQLHPGIPLTRAAIGVDEAITVAAELYRDLSSRPLPSEVTTLPEIMTIYLANARARLPDQAAELSRLDAADLLDHGLDELETLSATDGASAFLHGDYNPGNVLSSDHGWKVIDPKPMLGDREFDVFPLIEQLGSPFRTADSSLVLETLERHLLEFTRIVGCDPARAARWCFARSVLNLSWLLEDGNRTDTVATVREIRLWKQLAAL